MKGSLTFFDLGKIRFDNIQNSIWVHENEESACARGGEASERFILGNQVASLASNREPYCSDQVGLRPTKDFQGQPAIETFSLETLRVNGQFCGVTPGN
jgi:hypothetical protein